MNVIDETEAGALELSWRNHGSSDLRRPSHDVEQYEQRQDAVLKNLSRQTGLKFERSTAAVWKWIVNERGLSAGSVSGDLLATTVEPAGPSAQDKPADNWNGVGSATGRSRSVGTATQSPAISGEGRAHIQVDCLVLEIYGPAEFDHETLIASSNILGETPGRSGVGSGAPTPTAEELIKQAAGTHRSVGEISIVAGDRQATPEQLDAMIDLLASRGFVKVLMNPTLEIVSGGQGRIQSARKIPMSNSADSSTQADHYIDVVDYLELTANVQDDGSIRLLTEGTINRELSRQNEGLSLAKSSFSTAVVIDSGTSLVMGGLQRIDTAATDDGKTQTEVLFVLTPTIVDAGESHDLSDEPIEDKSEAKHRIVSALTTRATPPVEGAAPIRVGCFVLEIPYYPSADKNIARDAWTILGDKMSVLPVGSGLVAFAARLLKGSVEGSLPPEKNARADFMVTQAELERLIRMLAAGGYIRILFEPTVLLTDGQTAEVKTDGQSFRVKADLLDDGDLILQTHVSVGSEISPEGKEPIATRRTFDTTVHLRPGRAAIMGGTSTPLTSVGPGGAKRAAEMLCILTTALGQTDSAQDDEQNATDNTGREQDRRNAEAQARQRFEAALGPLEAAVASDMEDSRIKKSAEMLMYFGRAMLIYANDHDGRYPSFPDQLREYLKPNQFSWAKGNIEYMAAGRTTSSRPDVVTAYDLKLMAQEKGTNVLFNDCHVEFVEPERLRELNLHGTPVVIETRILTADDDFLKSIENDANLVGTSEVWLEHLRAASAADLNSQPYMVILDDLQVNFLLSSVAAHDGAKMLAAPKVCVLDGREAIIKMVSEEYHLARPTDPNGPPEEAKPKPEAIEVGTSVRLIPHVTPSKQNVDLDFQWVLRQIQGFEQRIGPGNEKQKFPLVVVNETRTTTTIPDGRTLVVGRQIAEQVEVSSKTPVLGDLPLVGGLFRSYAKITEQKTLLILIKPTVDPKETPGKPSLPLDPDVPLPTKHRE
jgi:type II secretory pathway component GspD/PulD (secretin)